MQSSCGGGAGGVYNRHTLVYKCVYITYTHLYISDSPESDQRLQKQSVGFELAVFGCWWEFVSATFCGFLKKKNP